MKQPALIILTLFLLTCLSQSCSISQPLWHTSEDSLPIGVFENKTDSAAKHLQTTIWKHLNRKSDFSSDSAFVRLEFNKKNKLEASLIINGINVTTEIIKGKLKEGNCYYIKKRHSIIPFFPVFWSFSTTRKYLFVSENRLIIESNYSFAGGFFFLPAGTHQTKTYKYNRLN